MLALSKIVRPVLVAVAALCMAAASPTVSAAESYVVPTAIPDAPAQQAERAAQLAGTPAEQRTLGDWKQLALLQVTAASATPASDTASLDTAAQTVTDATATFPNDAELVALGGSITAMRARDPALPGVMAMAYAKQGFRQLDRAVAMSPLDLGARLQRGITAVRTPPFLGKIPGGREDLVFVLDHLPANSDPGASQLTAMLHYLIGEADAALGSAQQAALSYRQAAALNAGTWSARAQDRLKD